jgi:hypothetical protein
LQAGVRRCFVLAVAGVAFAAAAFTHTAHGITAPGSPARVSPYTPATKLPRQLAASVAPLPPDLVAAIAVDFDNDGDLDVIATDEALQLLVWVNDGRDHLTRRSPARTTGWQTDVPPPSLDDLLALSDVTAKDDPPSFRISVEPLGARLSDAGALQSIARSAAAARFGASLTSRGPPPIES